MTLTKFFKNFKPDNISQTYHAGHLALDIVSEGKGLINGYGKPLCAPEQCLVLGISGDTYSPDNHTAITKGYGVRLRGMETGHEYLFWHCMPLFPVWGGQTVQRGQIVAYMANSGNVYMGTKYVPIEQRLVPPYRGTHLHFEMFKGGNRISPLSHINWSWEPNYTLFDQMKAFVVVLEKAVKLRKGIF